jgi:hypothetical protein
MSKNNKIQNNDQYKCKYIVELFGWDSTKNTYKSHGDCLMILDTIDGMFQIMSASFDMKDKKQVLTDSSQSPSSQVYIKANIYKDDLCVISRVEHNIASMYNVSQDSLSKESVIVLDYEIKLGQKKFGVRFDSRSNASGTNFYEEYMNIKTRYQSSDKYPSGNIRIEGMKSDQGYNGLCVEYYDERKLCVKYIGEFEDGKYDGEGEFFSKDGNVRLSCKNICSGKPNGIGRLIIGKNHDVKTLTMKDFSDLSSKSDNYVNDIYHRIDPKYQETLDLLNFAALSIEDRTMYLFKELRKLKELKSNNESSDFSGSSHKFNSLFGFS